MCLDSIKKILGHCALPALLVALVFVISIPVWRIPLSGDDLCHESKLRTSGSVGQAVMTLFDWSKYGQMHERKAVGLCPWWTHEGRQESFWRPLSAASHWLDHYLWPSNRVLFRIHSAAWFALFLVLSWGLYRQLEERRWVSGLAGLLLTLKPEDWESLKWIAARNSLIAACFVALTIWLYHRHVRGASWKWGVAAWVAFAAGLLAGEGAVTAATYLFSYSLFLDDRPWKARMASLAPFALIALSWRGIYHAMGFGVSGSGIYIDPGGEPVRYALNLLEWSPILALDQFTGSVAAKYAMLSPWFQPWVWGLTVAGLIALATAFLPLLRRERTARFWALGLILALFPACARTLPGDRTLLFAAIGSAPLLATFLAGLVDGSAWLPKGRIPRRLVQGIGILFVIFHLLKPVASDVMRMIAMFWHHSEKVEPIPSALRAAASQQLIIVNPPNTQILSYLSLSFIHNGIELPAGLRVLSSGLGDITLFRTGTNTLVETSTHGPLIPARPRRGDMPPGTPFYHDLYKESLNSSCFRPEEIGFSPGDNVVVPCMTVVVDRVNSRGFPTQATFTFARSLDDAGYHWVYWDSAQGLYSLFTPPRVGEQIRIAGPLIRK